MSLKGYTTKGKVENLILQDIDASFDTQIDNWIEAIERYIDEYTGRYSFIADDSATPRSYDGNGRQYLNIDDCVEVTKVEVGNDQWGDSQSEISASGTDRYYTLPTNNDAEGVPINKIGLRARYFARGHANHTITAKWGWSVEVPKDIEFVATVFVAGILNQHRQGGDEIKSERIGEYQVTYNTDSAKNSFADLARAKQILEKYVKYEL